MATTTSKHPDNYCFNCKKEVQRCWDNEGMCSGGGHCLECGGYNFPDALEDGACCDRDHDGDGSCDRHSAPGVDR